MKRGSKGAGAFLGLGSNLGDREANLARALELLAQRVRLEAVSPVYASEPAGHADQPEFLNLVARVRTDLGPEALLDTVQAVERAMGRKRSFRNAPRVIDIDLLLYEGSRRSTERLTLPHPRMHRRAFVLRPLADLDPDLEIPGVGPVAGALEDELEGAAARHTPGPRLRRWIRPPAEP